MDSFDIQRDSEEQDTDRALVGMDRQELLKRARKLTAENERLNTELTALRALYDQMLDEGLKVRVLEPGWW